MPLLSPFSFLVRIRSALLYRYRPARGLAVRRRRDRRRPRLLRVAEEVHAGIDAADADDRLVAHRELERRADDRVAALVAARRGSDDRVAHGVRAAPEV